MSTFSATATKVGYVTNVNSNSWNTKGAFQGQYKGWSGSRVGAIIFDSLRDITWSEQTISRIKLALTYAPAGANSSKTLKIYKGTKNTLTGTGSAMLGDLLGTVSSNGNAYNTTKTITFDANTNSTLFDNLKSYLINGSTKSIALYNAETAPSSGYSTNYLEVTGATIYVDYETAGSTGTISPVPVKVGGTVRCDITRMQATGTVTHQVQWVLGDHRSSVYSLSYGTLYSNYTIPSSWEEEILNNPSGDYQNRTGQCILTTLVDGAVRATRYIEFVVTLSDSAYPTFTATISNGPYYQGRTYSGAARATLSFGSYSVKNGASVKEFKITGSEDFSYSSSTTSSTTINKFTESGTHTYTFTLTDSRGISTTHTETIEVIGVAKPVISTFTVKRCSYDSNTSTWKDTSYGTRVRINLYATVDPLKDSQGNYHNSVASAEIFYSYYNGSSIWPSTEITITPISPTNTQPLITMTLQETSPNEVSETIVANYQHTFKLTITDALGNTSTMSVIVPKSTAPVHIAGTGYGLGIGMYSTGTESDPVIQSAWRFWTNKNMMCTQNIEAAGGIYGGTLNYKVPGTTQYEDILDHPAISSFVHQNTSITTLNGNFTIHPDGGAYPSVYRDGYVVQLHGILTTTAELTCADNNNVYAMFTIPDGYRPAKQVIALMQGSGTSSWLIRIQTTGSVTASRYRDSNGYANFPSAAWLPFHVTWMVG